MFLKRGLLFFTALAFLAFAGQASAGPNANAVLSVDIDASDNKMNDGNTSGTAVAGTDVVVEIFISGLAGPIVGGVVTFDTDKLTVKSAAPAAGFFALGTTANTVSLGAVSFWYFDQRLFRDYYAGARRGFDGKYRIYSWCQYKKVWLMLPILQNTDDIYHGDDGALVVQCYSQAGDAYTCCSGAAG